MNLRLVASVLLGMIGVVLPMVVVALVFGADKCVSFSGAEGGRQALFVVGGMFFSALCGFLASRLSSRSVPGVLQILVHVKDGILGSRSSRHARNEA